MFNLAFCLLVTAFAATSKGTAHPQSAMNTFINQLMAKMTLDEKTGQLAQYTAEMAVTGSSINDNYRDEIIKGRVGSIFNAYTPAFTRQLQQIAVDKTRLKIPLLFAYDVIHGFRTIFPIPLGESSTWDLKRMELSAQIAAREAASDGLHWTFAPMVDVARDPRWGRISEGNGEDTFLGSQIASVKVRGYQGEKLGSLDHIMACVKHFAAYGAVIAGREYNSVSLSERELFEVYLPPFFAAVQAGVATLMPSFNDIDGIPSTANSFLLRKVLRDKWKFGGIVVSDYTAVNELVPHGVVADEKHAAQLALTSGLDMDMQGGTFAKYLPELVREGKVPKQLIDQAVRRILEAKYQMGLFTDPYRFSDEARSKANVFTKENREVARDIARRSIVLLKNDQTLLPLKKQGTIALIGPLADDKRNMIGNWSGAGEWKNAVSLREGITEALGNHATLLYARGSNIIDSGKLLDKLNASGGEIAHDPRPNADMIQEAVNIAKKADVVIMALGESQGMSGEAASRTRIRIPENQQALLQAVREKSGKPIVLLLSNGRPLVLESELKLATSVVETWFLGTESGHAIADVLFGDYNPSGRLTITFPMNEGQIPIYYNTRNTGRPFDPNVKYTTKYLDAPNEPQFPFGFGLSYTQFKYSVPKLSHESLSPKDKLHVSVTVTNSGSVDGEETVQLYVRDMVASVSRPVKQLRGFRKVFLSHGESQQVDFELGVEDLKFYNQDMKWVAEPGAFHVMVGPNSRDLQQATFNLVMK